jgi:hypothetical protein
LTTITSGGSVYTSTSVIPVTYFPNTASGAAATSTSLINPSFNSALTNASVNHGGLSIALFVIYILHFLFRV